MCSVYRGYIIGFFLYQLLWLFVIIIIIIIIFIIHFIFCFVMVVGFSSRLSQEFYLYAILWFLLMWRGEDVIIY